MKNALSALLAISRKFTPPPPWPWPWAPFSAPWRSEAIAAGGCWWRSPWCASSSRSRPFFSFVFGGRWFVGEGNEFISLGEGGGGAAKKNKDEFNTSLASRSHHEREGSLLASASALALDSIFPATTSYSGTWIPSCLAYLRTTWTSLPWGRVTTTPSAPPRPVLPAL